MSNLEVNELQWQNVYLLGVFIITSGYIKTMLLGATASFLVVYKLPTFTIKLGCDRACVQLVHPVAIL